MAGGFSCFYKNILRIFSACLICCGVVLPTCAEIECDDYKCWRTVVVGNTTFRAFDRQSSEPALHIADSDGLVWHVSFSTDASDAPLHVEYEGTVYSAVDSVYEIVDGKLLWAHPDIYLESTGTQYIDTKIRPSNTNGVRLSYQYLGEVSANRQIYIGVETNENAASSTHARFAIGGDNTAVYGWNAYNNLDGVGATGRYVAMLNYQNDRSVYYDGIQYVSGLEAYRGVNYPMFLFCSNAKNATAACSSVRIYSVKITDGPELVLHLVPVPVGMQIGDFTVPSNGMFDIISQTFFGNSGTGDFIYGTEF